MKKLLSVLAAAVILLAIFIPFGFAAGNGAVTELADPDGILLGVSNRGLWHSYPENSLEGISAAGKTGMDFVLVDVRKTADGKFVLLKDETTGRMLTGENKAVSEMTSAEISERRLMTGCGGAGSEESGYAPAFLDEAFGTAESGGFSLMLNAQPDELGTLFTYLEENGMNGKTAVIVNAKADVITSALENANEPPLTIGVKKGNVIFAVNSYIRKTAAAPGGAGVLLRTKNRYGVNFHQTVLKQFAGNLRAVADTSVPELCGAREDSPKWWSDLISRGYSVIITDDAEEFCSYREKADAEREKLSALYEKYVKNYKLPEFKSEIFNDYKKAYTDAKNKADELLAGKCASVQELEDCCAALQKAVDAIAMNYSALESGSAGITVSPVRIGLCAGAAAVVIAVQIFFYKKRKEAK